ncbi:DNA-binding transcriptional activator PspC [Mangrovibacter phragmitis]|jgi:phage shock protein C|uniref:DNA-binding transcriptional activator PspC n=1 Tax=Mangrovibacter phragmitis TaxID=1691903 RepID=A0A1B7L7Q2_9ENTR|nr:envelope stress response membrane protein PspC [Mangrovibacter phragmitis]OAT78377.1 DNA-binding transcriptional activator PspC [Mangrovibacter phragmitis]
MAAFHKRKLWRNPQQGMIKGVCAGIAEYLDVPVKLVRAITVLSLFFGLFFFVVVAYIALTFALDPRPEGLQDEQEPVPDNHHLLAQADQLLGESERRLQAMERYITSDSFTLRSRFRQL